MVFARIIAPSADGKNLEGWRDSAKVLAIGSEARGNPDSVRKGDSKCNDEDLTPHRFCWARAPRLLYRAIPFASASSVFRVFCGSACSWLCWAGCLNQRRRPKPFCSGRRPTSARAPGHNQSRWAISMAMARSIWQWPTLTQAQQDSEATPQQSRFCWARAPAALGRRPTSALAAELARAPWGESMEMAVVVWRWI